MPNLAPFRYGLLFLSIWALLEACARYIPPEIPYIPPPKAIPGKGTTDSTGSSAPPTTGNPGNPTPPPPPPLPPSRVYLDNGLVKVGVSLNAGGAITFLSDGSKGENMVNNYDLGRQIQASYFSGPVPFSPPGTTLNKFWRDLGWNPIQAGDCYGNAGKVLEYRVESNQIYVRSQPLHWPLANYPGECIFETWVTLDQNVVKVRTRLLNARPDRTQYSARPQELPVVYVNGPYNRVFSYTGLKPFTGDAVTQITTPNGPVSTIVTENWMAAVNDQNRGLGIYKPNHYYMTAQVYGKNGAGSEYDWQTTYITPIYYEIIDHNIQYEYSYDLIVGTLNQIREYVYNQPRPRNSIDFRFENDRQHWHYMTFAEDTGWPIKGELNVPIDQKNTLLISGFGHWEANAMPKLYIQGAFKTDATSARLRWQLPGDPEFLPDRILEFPIIGDGQYRTYELDMTAASNWRGAIRAIALEPALGDAGGAGKFVKIQSITTVKP